MQPCEIEIPTEDDARFRVINSRECLPRCWEGCCSSSSPLYIRFAQKTHAHTQSLLFIYFLTTGVSVGEIFPRLLIYFWTWTKLGSCERKVSGTGV